MAPRKPKAAGEDDQCPMLKLIMEKGPLSGQTFDFKPGCLISIGRIVRGNTVTIKDAGVSSKHLLIQVEAAPNDGRSRWTATDLGSSNGTFLNGAAMGPSAVLSDDDTIIIGEKTSIRVKFEANWAENEASSKNLRRNARRGARTRAADLGVIDELSELGLGNKEDEKKSEKVAEVEVKQGKNMSIRRTRNSKKNETESNDVKLDENKDLGLIEAKELQGVSTRRTRSSRTVEYAPENGIALGALESRKPENKGKGRKRLPVKNISEEIEKEEESRRSEVGINKSSEGIGSGKKDDAAGLGSTSGVTESNVKTGKGKMVADLETMTLGQWFDFLEVYLPQQIIDETEAMIAEMRQKAERFHEFMLEQKKSKGKSKVTI